jgi:hypothetical protein
MIKIKVFDIALTGAAFAALIFVLPPDQTTTVSNKNTSESSSPTHSDSKTAHQNPKRDDILRTT